MAQFGKTDVGQYRSELAGAQARKAQVASFFKFPQDTMETIFVRFLPPLVSAITPTFWKKIFKHFSVIDDNSQYTVMPCLKSQLDESGKACTCPACERVSELYKGNRLEKELGRQMAAQKRYWYNVIPFIKLPNGELRPQVSSTTGKVRAYIMEVPRTFHDNNFAQEVVDTDTSIDDLDTGSYVRIKRTKDGKRVLFHFKVGKAIKIAKEVRPLLDAPPITNLEDDRASIGDGVYDLDAVLTSLFPTPENIAQAVERVAALGERGLNKWARARLNAAKTEYSPSTPPQSRIVSNNASTEKPPETPNSGNVTLGAMNDTFDTPDTSVESEKTIDVEKWVDED